MASLTDARRDQISVTPALNIRSMTAACRLVAMIVHSPPSCPP